MLGSCGLKKQKIDDYKHFGGYRLFICLFLLKMLMEIKDLIYSTEIVKQSVAICNGNKFPGKF